MSPSRGTDFTCNDWYWDPAEPEQALREAVGSLVRRLRAVSAQTVELGLVLAFALTPLALALAGGVRALITA
jgi:hypothetical protein